MHAADGVSEDVHAAAHYEGESWIVIRVAIRAIGAVYRDVRNFFAALL